MSQNLRQKLGILILTLMVGMGVLGSFGPTFAKTNSSEGDIQTAHDVNGSSSQTTAETSTNTNSENKTPENSLDKTGLRAFPLQYLNIQKNSTPGIQGTQGRSYLEAKNPVAALILQIINFIALTIASLSFLAMVVAGFMILVSAGDANTVTQGKTVMTHAAIGLAITLSAYYIVAFVQMMLFETVS